VTPLLIPTMVNQALINTIISNPITITVIDSPLPRTYQSLQVNNSISGFLGAFVFSMALAFKFASIISFIVKEREDRCKHQQIVSGMSIYAYWFGNFIFDLFLYLIVAFFAAGMCMAFGISSLTDGDALTGTWVLFVLYGLANIPFSYLASFLFTDYGSSQAAFYFFNFLAGGLISVVILVLRNIGDTAGVVARALAWVFRLIPAFSFGEGLTN
jgi:ATP-binding cassette subfamily A (ABC1) protein 3